MSDHHIFQDEWLARAAGTLPGGEARVAAIRAARRPRLFDALLDSGAAEGAVRAAVLAAHGVASLTEDAVERPAAALVPENLCRRYRLVPVRLSGEKIEVAMENPLDLAALADVQAIAGRTPVPLYARPKQIDGLLSLAFSAETVVSDLVERLDETATVEVLEEKDAALSEDVRGPVEDLASSVIAKAFHMRASDIHLEHDEHSSTLRYRIDGDLKNIMRLPHYVGAGPLVSRLKIMANLDIADRLRPQDGRAKLRIDGVEIGLRVSTLPTNFGEKVVIRLLDKRTAQVPFEQLGFRPDVAQRLGACLKSAQGVLLVTGPTGSGKTTTLYSILNLLKSETTNIMTVEDPVEYKLDGINQTQVQEKQGLTFAAVLRSVLRQDPDVIMVGEIRDLATAETAMQAALTGHLVVSTLHTNDAVATIARLTDLGVARFQLAPALIAITAQRLVRTLCPACRVAPDSADEGLAAAQRARGLEEKQFLPKGCAACDFQGYKGRTSLVELLVLTPGLRKLVAAGKTEADLTEFALAEKSLSTLTDDALWHIARGDTSVEEVLPYVRRPDSAAEAKAPAATPAAAAPASPAAASTGARILVVDDDATIRLILRKTLEGQGYRVTEAADGLKALAAIAASTPDMLLVDLHMPGLDGYGVLRGVRESLGLMSLPIIMLTADSDDRSQAEAFKMGADDYIVKPIKLPIVAARVKAAFRRAAV